MAKTWEEVEAEIEAYHNSNQYKIDQAYYRVRRFITSPLRWRYHIKHWYQRASRGYSDSDAFNFDSYVAGLIAGHLRWVIKNGHGVSMMYAYDMEDEWNPNVDIMVLRRNKDYTEIAEIFEEYAKNGQAVNEEWREKYGGVLDKDMDYALEWFNKHFQSLWD